MTGGYPCPSCARLAIREVLHAQQAGSNVREATYLCESGHVFILKWLSENSPLTRENTPGSGRIASGSGGASTPVRSLTTYDYEGVD